MDMTNTITKKQKRLIEKYADKYGKQYLTEYVQEKYPSASWKNFNKEHAQYLITGRKKHERRLKEYEVLNQVEKPTEEQVIFIKIIEEEWGEKPFTGASKKEATQYISQKVPSFLGGDCDDK